MTVNEIFGLRNQGKKEEAYEAARHVYAVDKSPYASAAMFWTAVDVLRMRANDGRMDEAKKIYQSLERLLHNVKDEKGWMHDALDSCQNLLERGEKREALSDGSPKHIQMGVWGEEFAAVYLREKGYIILERDWHSKHRDIDIIAWHDGYIVFVEVKTRHNRDFADPLQSVNYEKQKNLCRAINHYLHFRKPDYPWRFDVITIVGELGTTKPEITHIEDFRLQCRW